jgi:hypothetical protein
VAPSPSSTSNAAWWNDRQFWLSPASNLPSDTATILVPVEVQKAAPHELLGGARYQRIAPLIAPAIDMASMLNSTAKQAIQANAKRCRDMTNSVSGAIKGLFSLNARRK